MSLYGWLIVAAAALLGFDVVAFGVWAFLVFVVRRRYERTFSVDTRPRP